MSAQRERALAPRDTAIADHACEALAALRIGVGLLFLWAFADKLLGLGYATAAQGAWARGGSPTRGFLSGLHAGPLAGAMRPWAGAWWADWLFMLGLLGIGVAVTLGVALRISATAGTLMMLLMWAAEWPLARLTDAGAPTRSTNPIIDDHVVYALVLIALAATMAGHTWGLGRRWAAMTRNSRWLL